MLLLLFLPIMNGCKTTRQKNEIQLPPKPERQEINLPEKITLKDCAEIINYYEHLVQEWEEWADVVEEIIL